MNKWNGHPVLMANSKIATMANSQQLSIENWDYFEYWSDIARNALCSWPLSAVMARGTGSLPQRGYRRWFHLSTTALSILWTFSGAFPSRRQSFTRCVQTHWFCDSTTIDLGSTGWHISLIQISRWHQNKSSVLVHGLLNKMEVLFWCQQEVWINEMCHPVRTTMKESKDHDIMWAEITIGWDLKFVPNVAFPFGLAPTRPAAAAAQIPPHPALLPGDGGGGRVRDPCLPARPALPPAAEQTSRPQDQTSQAEEAPFTVSRLLYCM